MEVIATPLAGLYEVRIPRIADPRGYFARGWDATAAAKQGLDTVLDQWLFSFNHARLTLRGLHWQSAPHEETKLVRCLAGEVWDVAVDMRPDSPTLRRWHGVTLSSDHLNALWIPPGFAHGFLTLTDNALVQYGLNGTYSPEHARGARWNDPAFDITWPGEPAVINERDAGYGLI